jgi:hypothetical protein
LKRFVADTKPSSATAKTKEYIERMNDTVIQTGQDKVLAKHAPDDRPAPKWVALVEDRVLPAPRRNVTAQTIKDQVGIGADLVLLRDHQTRNDVVVADSDELDLAAGNVFRVIPRCEAAPTPPCYEPPKLAFVVDDEWKITLTPGQTGATLRRLFDLPADIELLRDHESPHDQPIANEEVANFTDGPVFRTEHLSITVKVNRNPVKFHKGRVTVLEIKQTAIAQKVKIALGDILYKVEPDGSLGASIGDSEKVTLKECEEFRCVTPDDNS